ncbi:hypothetical protein LTR39_000710 [Cryomyces antarcticus]|nr:hypothetical protein LTR39_000710 [Cryomyces antarcticus]
MRSALFFPALIGLAAAKHGHNILGSLLRRDTAANTVDIMAPCSPQPGGYGPVPSPNTDAAFQSYALFGAAANAAVAPTNWYKVYSNLNGSQLAAASNVYLGYQPLQEYSPAQCAALCDATAGCVGTNLYFERSPSLFPAANCSNPAAMTLIKCALWGSPVGADQATNTDQWREQFHVVVAGSDGFMKLPQLACSAISAAYSSATAASTGATREQGQQRGVEQPVVGGRVGRIVDEVVRVVSLVLGVGRRLVHHLVSQSLELILLLLLLVLRPRHRRRRLLLFLLRRHRTDRHDRRQVLLRRRIQHAHPGLLLRQQDQPRRQLRRQRRRPDVRLVGLRLLLQPVRLLWQQRRVLWRGVPGGVWRLRRYGQRGECELVGSLGEYGWGQYEHGGEERIGYGGVVGVGRAVAEAGSGGVADGDKDGRARAQYLML